MALARTLEPVPRGTPKKLRVLVYTFEKKTHAASCSKHVFFTVYTAPLHREQPLAHKAATCPSTPDWAALAHARRGSNAHQAPTDPAPSSVPVEETDGRQPQKIQSPCGGLGAPPARRHVQPAHTAGLRQPRTRRSLSTGRTGPSGRAGGRERGQGVGRPSRSRRGGGHRLDH
eukprot:scaffold24533_cov48-Phaeocystis_antarctica.AAC.1